MVGRSKKVVDLVGGPDYEQGTLALASPGPFIAVLDLSDIDTYKSHAYLQNSLHLFLRMDRISLDAIEVKVT